MSSLQEKYNDWMDAGENHADFCEKHQLFGWKHKETIHELVENYQKLKEKKTR